MDGGPLFDERMVGGDQHLFRFGGGGQCFGLALSAAQNALRYLGGDFDIFWPATFFVVAEQPMGQQRGQGPE